MELQGEEPASRELFSNRGRETALNLEGKGGRMS